MTVKLNDIDVYYQKSGSGPPVVFIHGLAEDHRSWSGVQEAISDICSYAYDLRGHGRTSLGEPEGTLAQLGSDLIAFLEGVSGPATCVGFSLGGTVVLWAAARRPDLVRHAVVIGTSSIVGRTAEEFFAQRIALVQTDLDGFRSELRSDTAAQLMNPNSDLDAVVTSRYEAVGDGQGYINAAMAMAGIRSEPLTPLLEKIEIPVDVICADQDVFCPKKAADIICDGISNSVYREIPDAGHLMSIDQPELYSEAIRTALMRND